MIHRKTMTSISFIVLLAVLLCCPHCTLSDRIRSNAIASSAPSDDEGGGSNAVAAKNSVLKGQILEEDEEKLDVERRKRERLARASGGGLGTRIGGTTASSPSSAAEESSSPPSDSISSSSTAAAAPAATEPQYDPYTNNFLILLRTKDGLSHWKYVVNDVFLLAMDTNRTLVEPCIKDGKIHPCMHLLANETLTLSTIVDMSEVKKRYGQDFKMIPWAEYQLKYMSTQISIVCYKKDSRNFEQAALDFDNNIIKPVSTEGNDRSYEDCIRTAKNFGNSVYLHAPAKEETLRRGVAMQMSMPWKYAPFQHTIATRIMKDAKIDLDKYFVFNWRMEGVAKKRILPCAKMLIAMSEEWLEKMDGDRLNAMLVTDLSFDKKDPKWGDMTDPFNVGIQGNATKILTENFFKIETSNAVKSTIKQFPRYRDPIFLTIWEIIISEKAILFVSCSKKNEVCDYCQTIKSKFSEDIIRSRTFQRLNSYESWPINEYTKTKPVEIAPYLAAEAPTR